MRKHAMGARGKRQGRAWQPPYEVSTRQAPCHACPWDVFELSWVVLIFLKILRELLDIFIFKELIKDKICEDNEN